MSATPQRVREIQDLFLRGQRDWRSLFLALESGDGSLLEDPLEGLGDFLETCEPEDRAGFAVSLGEMIQGDIPEDQALALSIVGSCREPFDGALALARKDVLFERLETRLELVLTIGQRAWEAGRDVVDRALEDPRSRHAASIALAQLDPSAAGAQGKEAYEKDRDRILATLARPLEEQEYATFYQMALGVLQVRGKEGVNAFLRAVADGDEERRHEMAMVVKRLVREQKTHES